VNGATATVGGVARAVTVVSATYMSVVRGTDQRFPEWRTPVYRPVTV